MGLTLERRNLLTTRSDRVKCVDFHPTEPWVLASLYSGVVTIWNYQSQTLVKSIEVCDLPVRTAKFIARKNWVVVGSDDLTIRIFNYNTLEKVAQFDAHSDYIRSFAIHPTRPLLLSCSDDMTIKLWDWERGWKCLTTFEGHVHYVMAVVINPKDPNTFATASLDHTIKVWSFNAATPNYTLEGHEKGVNCLDYYTGGDRPYLVSGADDMTVRIWDYQNKTCVRVLEGHVQNVSAALFHPELPIILSGAEDGVVRVWNAGTFRAEATFNFSLDRVWSLACLRSSNEIAVGCDEGMVVFQLGRGEPAASMDGNGRLIWAKHNEILAGNIKQALEERPVSDGERIPLSSKELGHCEVYPQLLQHSPNGRFVVVCGDGEYIIFTALAWRNKTFGKALELVWASASNDYAIRESSSKLVLFQNFTESGTIRLPTSCDRLFGGVLLGAACAGGQLCFFDWDSCQLIRRIDAEARKVFWSEGGGRKVAICTEEALYILQYHEGAAQTYLEQAMAGNPCEDGAEEAFEFVEEHSERVVSGCWIGDCFVFINSNHRLAYLVGGHAYQIAISERPLYLVGYLPKENRLVAVDKDATVLSYPLSLSLIEYEAAVLRGDLEMATSLLPSLPTDQLNRVAQFLDSQGLKEQALTIATDPEFRFTLAMQLKRLDLAFELASHHQSAHKWRQLGDLALAEWKIVLAEKCFLKSDDLGSLLLLHACTGNAAALEALAAAALQQQQFNVAFTCYFITGRREECFELLVRSRRYPEAALFARAYLPSAVDRAVGLWREHLTERGHRAALLIADPSSRPDLFPTLSDDLMAEESMRGALRSRSLNDEFLSGEGASADGTGSGRTIPVAGMVTAAIGTGLGMVAGMGDSPMAIAMATASAMTASQQPVASPYLTPYEAAFSDHMSMEVNTGTGSMRADDLDDLFSISESGGGTRTSEGDAAALQLRAMERLSIHPELEEEHLPEEPVPEVDPTLSQFDDDGLHQTDRVSEPTRSPQGLLNEQIASADSSVEPTTTNKPLFDEEGWD